MRTRQLATQNLQATWLRLFSSYFEFLLTPQPAAAIVQAVVTPRRVEPTFLPRGTELRVTTPSGVEASFRTLSDLRVLPVTLERAHLMLRPSGGYRVVLEFQSRFGRSDAVGMLRLHTRYLDDYPTSARLLYNLRAHLERAHVTYDQTTDETTDGAHCYVSWGSDLGGAGSTGSGGPEGGIETIHPIERVRGFFHFPEQELFVNLQVPPSRKPWSRFSICLDLDARWPRSVISADLFQLFAVPAVNIRRESAETIVADGTQDSYPIRHPLPERAFELRSVLGVHQITDRGPEPLRLGALPDLAGDAATTAQMYEVEDRPLAWGMRPYLILRMPGALLKPRKLAVEATWYQPGFAEHAAGKLGVSLADRLLEGLDWRALGTVRAHASSPLKRNPHGMLQILALNMQSVLGYSELYSVLGHLGVLHESAGSYRRIPARLRQLRYEQAPDSALRGSGLRHIYHVKLEPYPPEEEALIWNFLVQVRELLDAWNQDATIELHVDSSGSPLALPIR